MAIKAIIFDCFGVLVISGRGALLRDFPHLVGELEDLRMRSDYGFLSREEYNRATADLTGIPVSEVESRYWKKGVRNESAISWVAQLKDEGLYKIGLLSNIGPQWIADFLPQGERQRLFDDEVLSSTVGIVKPDREIFQLAAERLGVDTSECVMIDDLLENIDGATSVGMQGIVFGTTTQTQAELKRLLGQTNA